MRSRSYASGCEVPKNSEYDDYKQAEKALDGVLERIKDGVGKHDTFNFKREISRKHGGAS
jgi:hypothetical protein